MTTTTDHAAPVTHHGDQDPAGPLVLVSHQHGGLVLASLSQHAHELLEAGASLSDLPARIAEENSATRARHERQGTWCVMGTVAAFLVFQLMPWLSVVLCALAFVLVHNTEQERQPDPRRCCRTRSVITTAYRKTQLTDAPVAYYADDVDAHWLHSAGRYAAAHGVPVGAHLALSGEHAENLQGLLRAAWTVHWHRHPLPGEVPGLISPGEIDQAEADLDAAVARLGDLTHLDRTAREAWTRATGSVR